MSNPLARPFMKFVKLDCEIEEELSMMKRASRVSPHEMVQHQQKWKWMHSLVGGLVGVTVGIVVVGG